MVDDEEIQTPTSFRGPRILNDHLAFYEEPSTRILRIDLIAWNKIQIFVEEVLKFELFVLAMKWRESRRASILSNRVNAIHSLTLTRELPPVNCVFKVCIVLPLQIRSDFRELGDGGLEVFDDFGGDDVRCREIGAVFEAFVF